MKIGFTGSPFLNNKIVAIYAVAITAVAGGILLLPAQAPAPNVVYNLFKVGQTTADQTLIANGWKPVGYSCQAANPSQIAQGLGSTVCGYKYATASHNLITNAGIDWLACRMVSQGAGGVLRCSALDVFIGLATSTSACSPALQAATDTTLTTGDRTEIAGVGLNRQIGAVAHTNGTATYTVQKTAASGTVFTASGAGANNICMSGLFNTVSAGAMVFENNFSSTNMIAGDTLAITWTVTL